MPVQWHDAKVMAKVRKAAMRGVINGVEAIGDNAVARIQSGEKTGRIYRRRGVEHQASTPGEAPAQDLGGLADGRDEKYDADKLTGTLTFTADYSADLEWGTENMEPRPYARPALTEEAPKIRKNIGAEIAAALK